VTTPTGVPGLDLERLRGHLASAGVLDSDRPLSAALLTGGHSNLSYVLQQGDEKWVLRRPPLGHVMPSAHDMSREHRVLSGLASVGFPVPRPVLLCTDESVTGVTFLLMDYVEGRVVGDAAAAASLDPADAGAICGSLVDTLVALHAVDAKAAGLEKLGRPDGYLGRQVVRWSQQWQHSRTRDLPALDALASALARRIQALPDSLPWSIVHGDYRLDNAILAEHGPQVRALVDWEMSTLGDPVADLAVMLVYWSRQGENLRRQVPVAIGVTDGPGFWERDQIIDGYARSSGRDLANLDTCVGLACFKLAVIVESIHFRTLSGRQLGTATQVDMSRAAPALAELGVRVLAEGTSALSS
jgi:aminoglycoside phosphotransferase (APT) family kinase protein